MTTKTIVRETTVEYDADGNVIKSVTTETTTETDYSLPNFGAWPYVQPYVYPNPYIYPQPSTVPYISTGVSPNTASASAITGLAVN